MTRDKDQDTARQRMVEEIARDFAETVMFTGRSALNPRLRAALLKVPRDRFVPAEEAYLAYVNTALPIGCRQTISQPFIVAIMTELLDLAPAARVLEIGTGSGYQAAILGELAAKIYSIEVIPELADRARQALQSLGYANVEVRAGDGNLGWPEQAPFDGIMVTAAAPEVPPALIDQLKPGGRLVVPVGPVGDGQILTVVTKSASGKIGQERTLPVAFVPLVDGA